MSLIMDLYEFSLLVLILNQGYEDGLSDLNV